MIYLIKENRTYDQVFGDLPKGNGDPPLAIFKDDTAPNHRALAQRFALFDDFYADAEVAADGHNWSTQAAATDYVDKTWPINYSPSTRSRQRAYDFEDVPLAQQFPTEPLLGDPTVFRSAAAQTGGYLWDNAFRNGARSATTASTPRPTAPAGRATCPRPRTCRRPSATTSTRGYPGYSTACSDHVQREPEWEREFRGFEASGRLPALSIMRLGNDHTNGTRAGSATPQSDMAVSHSRYWKDAAILVTEDDAQNGPDHVDAHRTVALLVSAYTQAGKVDSTRYGTASMVATLWSLLGLPPMSITDARANRMWGAFTAKANNRAFGAIAPKIVPFDDPGAPVKGASVGVVGPRGRRRRPRGGAQPAIWKSIRGSDARMPRPRHDRIVGSRPNDETGVEEQAAVHRAPRARRAAERAGGGGLGAVYPPGPRSRTLPRMVLRSPYPDVQIPAQSLTEYVLGGAAARGDKPALIDGPTGAVTTYAELADQVARTAAALGADGIGPGVSVGLLGPNSSAWPVAFHAVIALGATVTSINPLLTPGEIATQLRAAGAKAVIAAEPLRAKLADSGVDRIYPLDDLPAGDGEPDVASVDPERDLAVLPFSSGTTGLSKGVMLTHRNLVANMEQIRSIHRIDADDVLIGLLPFFHIYGQTVVINLGLSQGATIVIMPRFDMGGFLDLMERHRVTRAHVAPPVVLGLAKTPELESRELALRVVISGAAPLDADTANRAGERLGAPVRQGYGMTEASPVTHFASDEDLPDQDPGAIGRLVPLTEGRLVDPESGEDADAGEIWIRGPQVMRGYLADEQATADTLTEDGWLKTGDVARVEDGGIFRIVDRVKELIKYKGYQVPPAELEALLIGHPEVADAAVIPLRDADGEESPKACVVPAGDGLDPDELMAWVAERVAPYKRIRAVEIVEEIPKSASGKILRRLLRDRSE